MDETCNLAELTHGINQKKETILPDDDWPESGLEFINNCPVCGSQEREQLFKDLVDNVFLCAPGKWNLWKCKGCRNAYLNPRPTPETIGLAYEVYYTHDKESDTRYDSISFVRKLRRRFANGYRNWRYGSNLQPQSIFGVAMAYLIPKIKKPLDYKHRFLPKLPQGADILDVGFGTGAFMDMARDSGWKPVGVDLDPVVVKKAKEQGHYVSQGGIEIYAGQQEVFNAITMSHVIEHVYDPAKELSIAYELLKPGGCLMIDTPNLDSMGLEVFGEYWRGLEVPRHLVIFSWNGMVKLLNDIGFVEVEACPRYDVSLGMFEKSKAISKGILPHSSSQLPELSLRERKQCEISMTSKKRSEFATFIAKKAVRQVER